jgi:hypothetical protein
VPDRGLLGEKDCEWPSVIVPGEDSTPCCSGVLKVLANGSSNKIAKVKKTESACDDQADSINPGTTAAVDTCDTVAAGWDERVPEIKSISEQCLTYQQEYIDKTYPDPPVAFP